MPNIIDGLNLVGYSIQYTRDKKKMFDDCELKPDYFWKPEK